MDLSLLHDLGLVSREPPWSVSSLECEMELRESGVLVSQSQDLSWANVAVGQGWRGAPSPHGCTPPLTHGPDHGGRCQEALRSDGCRERGGEEKTGVAEPRSVCRGVGGKV